MTDRNQQGFKSLLEEEREKRGKPSTPQGVDKAWWKREKSYHFTCPNLDDYVCSFSRKFRKAGPYPCSGSWHQTCEVFLRVRNNGGDPTVLIHE